MSAPAERPRGLYDYPRLYDLMCPMLADGDPELAWWRAACADGGAGPGRGAVLELGAGTGRLAIPLARAGLAVTALDRSEAMLTAGRARAADAGVALTWVEGDMAGFALGRRFEAVIVALNSLMHLHTRAEHEALFAAVRAHLAPGGRLALSVSSPDPRTLGRAPTQRLAMTHGPVDDPVRRAPLTIEETIAYDHATQRTRGAFRFSYPERRDEVVVPVDLRVLWPAELEALLHYNGFALARRDGDFHGGPFTADSLVQNLVCRVADDPGGAS